MISVIYKNVMCSVYSCPAYAINNLVSDSWPVVVKFLCLFFCFPCSAQNDPFATGGGFGMKSPISVSRLSYVVCTLRKTCDLEQ